MIPRDLPATWRTEAGVLARYGDSRGAEILNGVAATLEHALAAEGNELLDLAAGSQESGYSVDRLRHMVAEGVVPNAGRKGAPRVRRADLPAKPRKTSGGFDAAATARSILTAS